MVTRREEAQEEALAAPMVTRLLVRTPYCVSRLPSTCEFAAELVCQVTL